MKRLLVSLLAILYLASGAGFTLREHYCMGQKIGAAIEHTAHHTDTHRCDRCGMEQKRNNGCCKDEVKTFKSSPEQVLAKALSIPAPLFSAVLAQIPQPTYGAPVLFAAAALPAAPLHGPPLSSGVPRYLRVRSIRI